MTFNNTAKLMAALALAAVIGFLISSCVVAKRCRNICAPSEPCRQKCMTEYEFNELNGY